MTELMKGVLLKFVAPICACAVTGIASGIIFYMIFVERIDGRVRNLESQIVKHEKRLEKDFTKHDDVVSSFVSRIEGHERRLTRMETLMDGVNATLSEIRSDVKMILRGQK